jgi:hypothetical protein
MRTGSPWKLCHPLSQLCSEFGRDRLEFGPGFGLKLLVGRLSET